MLNTSYHTHLIKFKNTSDCFVFQNPLELVKVLKERKDLQIESIHQLIASKNRFIKESKKDFLARISRETEAYIYLKSQSFFKNVKS